MFRKLTSTLLVALALCGSSAHAQTKILISNDDGWASANIRAQYAALRAAGYNVSLRRNPVKVEYMSDYHGGVTCRLCFLLLP